MVYLKEAGLIDSLHKALQGNVAAREELKSMTTLHAFPADYSELVLVQIKKASVNAEGFWHIQTDQSKAMVRRNGNTAIRKDFVSLWCMIWRRNSILMRSVKMKKKAPNPCK